MGGLPFPAFLPCCTFNIPLAINTTVLNCFIGPTTGATPQNIEYLEKQFADLAPAVQTKAIEEAIIEELGALAAVI